jgi:PKD repeat protein
MKVRKIVAGLAAVSMLAAFSAQAVVAADTVSIKAGDASAKAGEEFTLEVSLEGLPSGGANVVEFAVTYDSKVATISSVTAGKAAQTGVDSAEKLDGVKGFEENHDTAGTITITYSTGLGDATYAIKDGVFAVITGKVAAGTAEGKYPVKIEAISRATVEGNGVTNKEVKAGLIGSDGTVTKYTATGVAGNIIVGTDVKPTEATEATKATDPTKKTYCDCNGDGAIDIVDVISFNLQMLGTKKMAAEANADVDDNGKIESSDGLNILKRVVGNLSDSDFPVKK